MGHQLHIDLSLVTLNNVTFINKLFYYIYNIQLYTMNVKYINYNSK